MEYCEIVMDDATAPPPHERSKPWSLSVTDITQAAVFAALIAACVVSMLFFSSFLRNPQGILDSVGAYRHYLARTDGAGIHDHPWHYYMHILLYYRNMAGPWWSEGAIVLLAIVGVIAAWRKGNEPRETATFPRFIAIYTIMMLVIYSLIPYKTPWCMLGFLHGTILLAGLGGCVQGQSVGSAPPGWAPVCSVPLQIRRPFDTFISLDLRPSVGGGRKGRTCSANRLQIP